MSTITDLLATMDYGPAPESDAPAQAWLDSQGRRFGHVIGGRRIKGGSFFDSLNPATGQVLAQVAQGTPALVEQAVKAAEAALPGWQGLGGHGRARHLYALARGLQKHARLFAVLETLDNGKPIRETRDIDIPLAVRHFYHHAGWAQLLASEFPEQQALGVVGQIVPWNFPLLMLAWKVAPALACGNTVVFKPAEQTPLSALLFAEVCSEAGLPPGVFNLVNGDGAVGEALVRHERIAKIAFTGSTDVGRAIRRATAGSGKKLSLELGGKSPYLVFADADLDAAVEGLVDSIFFNQGQVCCAGSRLLVHEGTAPALLARLKARMARIRVGSPLDKSTDMGALVSAEQLARVTGFVERARAEGADVFQASATALPAGGCFFAPTLVAHVDTASEIVQHEVFGPVLTVQTFRTPAEAVDLANNTRYGLAASLWSESIGLALDVAPRIKAGVVWVNSANQFDAACGFGGYRESGFGREGGREGLVEYLKPAVPSPRGGSRAARKTTVHGTVVAGTAAGIDRTPKLYIGGKQVRPDGGYSREVWAGKRLLGVVPEGNRKDIRNAVEAARAAAGWERSTAHGRAQVLYYLAENLDAQQARLVDLLAATAGTAGSTAARAEVQAAVNCLFSAAAWADKHDGAVHQPPLRGITLALHEAMGTVALVAPDEAPLLGLLQLAAPALAMGNRVVAVPSSTLPLVAAELYALLDTSDLPGGALNLVTGPHDELADVLAAHNDVDAFWWPSASAAQAARVQALSAGNLKRTWVAEPVTGMPTVLQQAVQVKNVWVPYGV
ncbi:aldehyde dehydrogenase family protein [Pseudorhodoferax sp.]|uniref:aldehyde dehydrogenase family protein n=1 Tax=Pseudorhodoferax sp. TaxID=1993553 RepID=UPI002DD62890|nr:aldehyde dehydrogenase family protein [Pseudorhodoferax sp.]